MAWIVRTGARLHFGLLSHGGSQGRQFGGLGLMIDRPGFELRAREAALDDLQAPDGWLPRLRWCLENCRGNSPGSTITVPMHLEVRTAPPAHAGFGSGTQLGMAVAWLVATIAGERELPETALALRAGRGLRSAIGVHGFALGGLLLEAGQKTAGTISPLVARTAIPDRRRFVLVRPHGPGGISGAAETSAFKRLPAMSSELTAALCTLAVREIIPAAAEGDFSNFAHGLWNFGVRVGEYFAPVQGGVFAHPQMRTLASRLRSAGYAGVAQTSWGPTLVVACSTPTEAEELRAWLAGEPAAAECMIEVAEPLNSGAGKLEVD